MACLCLKQVCVSTCQEMCTTVSMFVTLNYQCGYVSAHCSQRAYELHQGVKPMLVSRTLKRRMSYALGGICWVQSRIDTEDMNDEVQDSAFEW